MMVATSEEEPGQKDSALVAMHRAGNPLAFQALYNDYYHRLLRFVRKRVREDDLVEDIAQEAFARAYAAISGLRETGRFYPWLTMIARRLIIDHYRQRSRISLVADLDIGPSDSSDAPEGLLLEQEAHAELAQAMDRLRGRHRDVLHLREFEGLSYEQIAERLGVPATTVPPLLYRARVALRREYLLITEREGTAVFLPVMVFISGTFRRIRDRLAQVAAYLPDPQALTGSLAAMVVGVGGLLGPVAIASAPDVLTGPAEHAVTAPNAAAAAAPAAIEDAAPGDDAPGEGPGDGIQVPSQPLATFDKSRAEEARDHDGRAPHHIQRDLELGDLSISADPAGVREDSEAFLAGDDRWMED